VKVQKYKCSAGVTQHVASL